MNNLKDIFSSLISSIKQIHNMSQALQFGYFNLQGRGQVSRLLLAYTKTQYHEVAYTFAKIGDWLQNDKINLGLDFPSLPYLIDGKLKLTESKAIELYIINRAKMASILLGKNHKEQALIANIDGVLKDVFNALIGIFFAADFQPERKRVFPIIEQKLNYLNEYIGLKNHFLNRVTYVDFVVTVVFSYLKLFYPHQFSKWQNIQRVADFINGLPEIVEYYSTSGAISDVVAPEKANDPIFHNIPPINETQKQIQLAENTEIETKVEQSLEVLQHISAVQKQVKSEEQVPVVVQQQPYSNDQEPAYIEKASYFPEQVKPSQEQSYPVQQESSPVEEQSSPFEEEKIGEQQIKTATIRKIESNLVQEQVAHEKQQQNLPETHFNTRVSDYQKAVEATNVVEYSQINVDMQKTSIVTPSKIESSNQTNGILQASWKIFNLNQEQKQIETQNSSITLGYWGIRGLGQIQRHLLTYCGHEFTETIYKTRDQWMNADKKFLPFPNLPYLVSGDFRLTESLAIDRYIIRTSNKHELLGKDLIDETLIENIVKILSEIFRQLRVLCFTTQEVEQKMSKLQSRIETDFKRLNDFVQNKQFVFGYLTWADFYIAEISYYIEKIFPDIYEKYQFLKNIQQSVNKIEDIQKYYERETSVKGPFMPPSAKIFF